MLFLQKYSLILVTLVLLIEATPPPGYVKPPSNDKDPPRYAYQYSISNTGDGGGHGAGESRDGEHAHGDYYVNIPAGHGHDGAQAGTRVQYTADDWGFHPVVEYSTKDGHSQASARLALGEHAVKALKNADPGAGQKISSPAAQNSFHVTPHQPTGSAYQVQSDPNVIQYDPSTSTGNQGGLNVDPSSHGPGQNLYVVHPTYQGQNTVEQPSAQLIYPQTIQHSVYAPYVGVQSVPATTVLQSTGPSYQVQVSPGQFYVEQQGGQVYEEANGGKTAYVSNSGQKKTQNVFIISDSSKNEIEQNSEGNSGYINIQHTENIDSGEHDDMLIQNMENAGGYGNKINSEQNLYEKNNEQNNKYNKILTTTQNLVTGDDVLNINGAAEYNQVSTGEGSSSFSSSGTLYSGYDATKTVTESQKHVEQSKHQSFSRRPIVVADVTSQGGGYSVTESPVQSTTKVYESLKQGDYYSTTQNTIETEVSHNLQNHNPTEPTVVVTPRPVSNTFLAPITAGIRLQNSGENIEHFINCDNDVNTIKQNTESENSVEIQKSVPIFIGKFEYYNDQGTLNRINEHSEGSLSGYHIVSTANQENNVGGSNIGQIGSAYEQHGQIKTQAYEQHGQIGAEAYEQHGQTGAETYEQHGQIKTEAYEQQHGQIGAQAYEQHGQTGAESYEQHSQIKAEAYEQQGQTGVESYEQHDQIGAGAYEQHSQTGAESYEQHGQIGAEAYEQHSQTGAESYEQHGQIGAEAYEQHSQIGAEAYEQHGQIKTETYGQHTLGHHQHSSINIDQQSQVTNLGSHSKEIIFQRVPVAVPYPVEKVVEKEVHVPQPYPVEVTKVVETPVEKPYPVQVPVEVKVPYPVEKHVPYPVEVEKIVEKQVEVTKYVDKPYPVPVPQPYPVEVEKIVDRPVHVPVEVTKYIDRPYPVEVKVPHPVPYPVEKIVEKTKYVDKPYPVKVPVHVPYEVKVPVEVTKYVDKPYPVEKIVEKPIHIPYPVEKIVEKPVTKYVDKPYPVEVKVPVPHPVAVPVEVKVPQPYPVEVKVPQPYAVAYPHPYPVKVPYEKIVEKIKYIDKPYPVEVPVHVTKFVDKPYPVEKIVEKQVPVDRIVEKPYPVQVPHPVAVPIEIKVPHPYPVGVPYPVTKLVSVPVEITKLVNQYVDRPYPIYINSHKQHNFNNFDSGSLQNNYGQHNYNFGLFQPDSTYLLSQTKHNFGQQITSNQQSSFAYAPNYKSPLPKYVSSYFRRPASSYGSKVKSFSDYIGPVPSKNNAFISFALQKYRRHATPSRAEFGKNLRIEYGFQPPLRPSVETDEQGNPLKKIEV